MIEQWNLLPAEVYLLPISQFLNTTADICSFIFFVIFMFLFLHIAFVLRACILSWPLPIP